MIMFFEDFLTCLEKLHQGIERAIEDLPLAALDWIPGPEMNSLCVLVVHICGAERFWIGDMAGQDPSNRNRDSEFQASGWDKAALLKLLTDTLTHSRGVLENLNFDDLEKVYPSQIHGREYTVGWSLSHALEHTALHLGHMEITCQLWEQQGNK